MKDEKSVVLYIDHIEKVESAYKNVIWFWFLDPLKFDLGRSPETHLSFIQIHSILRLDVRACEYVCQIKSLTIGTYIRYSSSIVCLEYFETKNKRSKSSSIFIALSHSREDFFTPFIGGLVVHCWINFRACIEFWILQVHIVAHDIVVWCSNNRIGVGSKCIPYHVDPGMLFFHIDAFFSRPRNVFIESFNRSDGPIWKFITVWASASALLNENNLLSNSCKVIYCRNLMSNI